MSTKASPPATVTTSIAAAVVVSSVVTTSESSSSASTTTPTTIIPTGVKIKKEIANDEIKDFAETAMNELLGWYGYDNVELSSKATRLMTRNLHNHHHNRNNNNNDLNGSKNINRDDSTISDRDSSREDSKSPCSTKTSEKLETNCGWCRRIVPENSPEFLTTTDGPRYCSESCFAQSRRASFKRAKQCDWCRHIRHAVSYVDFQDGASQLQFCSDKCLNQYKMQIFCKETQAHLDMNPHLKEKLNADTIQSGGLITPELWLKNCRSRSISPVSDVSRSPTPSVSNNTINSIVVGPHPSNAHNNNSSTLSSASGNHQQQNPHKPLISVAPASKLMSKTANKNLTTTIPNLTTSTSTISVLNNRQLSGKHSGRKKRINLVTRSGIMHQISNNNNQANNLITNNLVNSSNNNNKSNKILLNSLNSSSNSSAISKTYQNVQDLRLNIPSISPNDLTVPHVPHQQQHQQHPGRQNLPLPPHPTHSFYSHSPGPNNFPPQMRPPFLSPPPSSAAHHHHHTLHSRLMDGTIPTQHQQHQQFHHQLPPQTPNHQFPPHLMPNDMINPLAALIGSTPPVTIMVPYPIILPIPIPIPLPIIDFLRAANLSNNNNNSNNGQNNNNNNIDSDAEVYKGNLNFENQTSTLGQNISPSHRNDKSPIDKTTTNQEIEKIFNCENDDEPLDFTKSKVTKIIEENLYTPPENEKKIDKNLNSKIVIDDEISNSSPLTDKHEEHMENSSCSSTVTNLKLVQNIPKNEDDSNCSAIDETQENNVKQKVPKFKITRLHTKRLITTSTKESECNRPLRKRKRIIDCYVTSSREAEKEECSKVKK